MTAADLNARLDADPFRPAWLRLADGTTIAVETPYLSFVLRDALYVARGTRGDADRAGLELVPLQDITAVVTSSDRTFQ